MQKTFLTRKERQYKKTGNNKQNLQLPALKRMPFNLGYSFRAQQTFVVDDKFRNKIIHKASRTESLISKHVNNDYQAQKKAERSTLRFHQMELLFRKTQMQKKKQKRVYSIDKDEGEQAEFIKTLNHYSTKKVKQEICQQIFEQQFHIKNLPNICYDSQFIYQREGPCLTLLNNKLYLYGGAIRRKFSHNSSSQNQNNCDLLFHCYEDNKWVKQQIQDEIDPDFKNLIYHTICPLNKKYIVLAGGMVGDSQQTLSKFNRSIIMYNTETKKLQEWSWNNSVRLHACVSFDNYVILHGGQDQKSQIKNQMHAISFNFASSHLTPKLIRFQTNQTLVGHQMVTTLGEDKTFRMNLRENNGIYLFGGESNNGQMDSFLKILKIYSSTELQKRGVKKFEPIKTEGEGPCARKNHSMSLVTNRYALVVIGGLDVKTNYLSDAWTMNLLQMKWCRIMTDPSIENHFGGICKHGCTSNNASIFVFGGHHLKENGNQNFWRIDLSNTTKKNKQKRISDISKVTSLWSMRNSFNQFGTLDKILQED